MKLTSPTDLELAYLAGFADGEGCFRFASGTPIVTVTNCYVPVLTRFEVAFGGRVARSDGTVSRYQGNKIRSQWRWTVSGPTARRVCDLLMPFLHEKLDQAYVLTQAHLYPPRSAAREALIRRLGNLKRVNYDRPEPDPLDRC